jgi:hypothetical protein
VWQAANDDCPYLASTSAARSQIFYFCTLLSLPSFCSTITLLHAPSLVDPSLSYLPFVAYTLTQAYISQTACHPTPLSYAGTRHNTLR